MRFLAGLVVWVSTQSRQHGPTPGVRPTAVGGTGVPTPSVQQEVQAEYDAARQALRSGLASVPETVRVKLGDTYTLRARICGLRNPDCRALATSPAPGASETPANQVAPVKVGARIGATVTSSGTAVITPSQEDVQYLSNQDSVTWQWEIKPSAAGSSFLTVRFRVLYGATNEALVANTFLKVPLVVTRTAGDVALSAFSGARGAVGWIVGIAAGLGITGGGVLTYLRRLRRARARSRASWERNSPVSRRAAPHRTAGTTTHAVPPATLMNPRR